MRRAAVALVLAVGAVLGAACDGPAVNAWLRARGLPPLPPDVAAEVGRRLSFVGEVHGVTAARLGSSWRPGCPVGPADLRLLRLSHVTADGAHRVGELVVHRDVARGVVEVFRTLFHERFPVARLQTVDAFGGNDDASMAANNTSGFNCRRVAGTSSWSMHAHGRAIDVNPLVNPSLVGGQIDPPAGAAHLGRATPAPGKITSADVAVRAFGSQGWWWGGYWVNSKDYMHFSTNGR